jgi:hypothetical protein
LDNTEFFDAFKTFFDVLVDFLWVLAVAQELEEVVVG